MPTKTEYALEHLNELHDVLIDRHHRAGLKIPKESFAIAAEFLIALGESTISSMGEPDITPGDYGELLLDWQPPKPEIHLVITGGTIHGDSHLANGSLHADGFTEVVMMVSRAARV